MSKFSILLAGDNFARTSQEGKDPYEFVRPILEKCQAAFCNLETVLTNRQEKAAHTTIHIRTGTENFERQTSQTRPGRLPGGFDAVSLANNHILDYGPGGMEDTISFLNEVGVAHTGAGFSRQEALQPALVEIRGVKVAFIGMAGGGSMKGTEWYVLPLDVEIAREAIDLARQAGASIVICSPHWGYELAHFPSPDQQAFGRGLIDAGADLVVGHHPHVVQGIENYRNRYIFYSLGNFNFSDVILGNEDAVGAVLRAVFDNNALQSFELTPVRINSYWQPVPLGPEKIELFKKWMDELSAPLAGGISWLWWRRRVGWAVYKRRLSAQRTIISRAKGMKQKLLALGRFATWFLRPKFLRWSLTVFLRSFIINRKQRYIPPGEFR